MSFGAHQAIRRIALHIVLLSAIFWVWRVEQAEAEPVRMAYTDVAPPFNELKGGEAQGLSVDIVRAAAGQAGIEIDFVPVPFEQLQRTLEDGRADVLLSFTITPERLARFDFSDPIVITGGALFVRAPETTPEGLAPLAGKIVVTPQIGPYPGYLQKNAPDVKLVVTANYEESLGRLVKGEADAAALGFHMGIIMARRLYPGQVTLPRRMFVESPFAVAAAKGQQVQFLTRLNAGIAAIRADGTWQQINDRWTGK